MWLKNLIWPKARQDIRDVLFSVYKRTTSEDFRTYCTGIIDEILKIDSGILAQVPNTKWNRKKTESYVQFIILLAEILSGAGHDDLRSRIFVPGSDNVVSKLSRDYQSAFQFAQDQKYEMAIAILAPLSDELSTVQGTAVDKYLPRIHGLMGLCYLKKGNKTDARKHTKIALDICRKLGDHEGVATYKTNMSIIDGGLDSTKCGITTSRN